MNQARPKKKCKPVRLWLAPAVADHVQKLLESGLHGRNYTKVVEGLFLRGLRIELGMKQ